MKFICWRELERYFWPIEPRTTQNINKQMAKKNAVNSHTGIDFGRCQRQLMTWCQSRPEGGRGERKEREQAGVGVIIPRNEMRNFPEAKEDLNFQFGSQ